MTRFRGIYTVPVTAFTPDDRIDEAAYRRLLDFIVTEGSRWFFRQLLLRAANSQATELEIQCPVA